MSPAGNAKSKSLRHPITRNAALLCLLTSCAVYEPSLLGDSSAALNGGSSGSSDGAASGSKADGAGRGGSGPAGTNGGGGAIGNPYPGGMDGGSSSAGSPDGGAADGGAAHGGAADGGAADGGSGEVVGGSGGHAGGGGSASGGSAGGTGGSAPIITNLSRDKPATVSGAQTGHEASKGNDGDGGTRWCAKAGTFPQWWRVDLGATRSLKEFKISFEYSDRKYYYDIETSADDANYTLQARDSGTGALHSGSFPSGVSARYVRITVTKADPGSSPTWASFFEFVVTGS